MLPDHLLITCSVWLCPHWWLCMSWQGMTITLLRVHLNRAFGAGMVYVALSRCVSLEGLQVRRGSSTCSSSSSSNPSAGRSCMMTPTNTRSADLCCALAIGFAG